MLNCFSEDLFVLVNCADPDPDEMLHSDNILKNVKYYSYIAS